MLTRPWTCGWRIMPFVLVLLVSLVPCHAAQFSADLSITSPQGNFVYDLKVEEKSGKWITDRECVFSYSLA
jgi:hypothetical protein